MPTETAPQPSVAAPAAVTPPAPVTPAPERAISSLTKKPISDAAHNLFKMLEESSDPMREEKKVETPQAEPEKKPEPAASTVAAPAAEPEKPIKVSKKVVKRPELPIPKDEQATPPAASAAAQTQTAAPVDDTLNDDQLAAIGDAELAEKLDPKFKGLSAKMKDYFRKEKQFLEAHPDVDETDPEYKKLLASAPVLSKADKRMIAEARIEERVEKKYKPELENIQHEIFKRDEEPKIENEAANIRRHMAFNALPKEMLTVLKEKGLPALQKDYADELEVAGGLINTLTEDAKELLRLTRIDTRTQRALAQAADTPQHPKWEQHNRIATMVNEVCADFQKNAPQAEQVRDGKWFVTREEWGKLPPNARHQFWTFTNSDEHVREMIDRAMKWMPGAIEQQIKARQDSLKARGYVRQRGEAAAPAAPATPPVASSAPSSPRPSPAPAPTSTPAGQMTAGQMLAARLKGE